MKNLIGFFLCLMMSFTISAQWDVNAFHAAFRYGPPGPFGQEESTHWTPGEIAFWTDDNYNVFSSLQPRSLRIRDNILIPNGTGAELTKDGLVFSDPFGTRISLDYAGLTYINEASWGAFSAWVRGNAGQFDIYNGFNGGYLARLGSTGNNSDRGSLTLYRNNIEKVKLDITSGGRGELSLKGDGGTTNVYAGGNLNNHGYIYLTDDNGIRQIELFVNHQTDRGKIRVDDLEANTISASVKNFKVPHPTDDNLNIWYACVEGPEAGAYDRGTATLKDGEAFVPYSDHYSLIANPKTATIQLTSMEWDTYGVAIIKKTEIGFYVKELKGGKGNFQFDWEVTSVRKGHEDFKVLRPKAIDNIANDNIDESIEKSSDFSIIDHAKSKVDDNTQSHKHTEGCIHATKK